MGQNVIVKGWLIVVCVELGQIATKSLIANDGGAIRLAGTLQ